MKIFSALKNQAKARTGHKIRNIFLIFFLLFILIATPTQPARAQFVVSDIGNTLVNSMKYVWDKVSAAATTLWQKAGSIAYQHTLSAALNKIAYDTANYIGSGHSGQKPLFITQDWGSYLAQVGDQSAGQFIETFVNNLNNPTTQDAQQNCDTALQNCNLQCSKSYMTSPTPSASDSQTYSACTNDCTKGNTSCNSAITSGQNTLNAMNTTPSINICSPSLEARIQIGLGLVNESQPQVPNCSASQMINVWKTDINQKLADLHNTNYLSTFVGLFNPQSNDLGAYVIAKSNLSSKALIDTTNAQTGLIAKGGWLDVTNIAGSSLAPPGTPQRQLQEATDVQSGNIGKITGDVFVDAANVFLNQLAMSAFNKLVQSIGSSNNGSSNNTAISTNGYTADPNASAGVTAVQDVTSTLLQPQFTVRADYDILSQLAVCPNPKIPGPTDCVIDDKFLQGISEKKTVAEAIANGYLHSDWQMTTDNNPYSYSLRNVEILRQYRILPVGWEEAINAAYNSNPPQKVTLGDLISCFSPNDQYNTFSSDFDPNSCSKYVGLVDPNWVLKAPLNYCKQQGFGAQILSTTILPGISANPLAGSAALLSQLSVVRADGYCADGQTCIKEKNDGSCEAYGYCNGEKRTWSFSTNSCDPVNNTCQSFTNASGQTISYLQNTLDYSNCNSGNAGCAQYALSGSYATSTGTVSWSTSQSQYFNGQLTNCSSQDEGCTGLLRVKPTWGNNLVMDSDYSNDQVGDTTSGANLNGWPLNNVSQATIVDSSQDPGDGSGKVLKLEIHGTSGGLYSNPSNSLLPSNFQVISSQSYTVSADVYLALGDNVGLAVGNIVDGYVTTDTSAGSWQHISMTRPASSNYSDPSFSLTGQISQNTAGGKIIFYVKNLKFEASDWDTGYSAYGYTPSGSAQVYEKLLPSYLEKACYTDAVSATKDYTLKPDAPAVCSNYARKCNQAEVGCESYTNVNDNFTVAAKVSSGDYCPAECLGYDIYIAAGSYFNSPATENLIPKTATACSAAAAGCNEFTNLDSLAQGGEQKEYYTSLKQCIKPSATQCASFYAWQGQGGGYQLQTYSLEQDAYGLPAVTSPDNTLCNAAIYNLPVSDPAFNPDCQEFYNAAGQIAYHLVSHTITCSDNCHAYRMTDKNVDSSLTAATCTGPDKNWNSSTNSCNVCLNGGTWDATSASCVYNAIPGEGQTCSANQNGCREYNGSTGSNVRLLSYYDFESGLGPWSSSCNAGVSISPVSNNKNGHSLQYQGDACINGVQAQLDVSGLLTQGSAYTLKFLAYAPADVNLTISFVNKDSNTTATPVNFSPVVVKGGAGWNIYQANLPELNQIVGTNASGTNESLVISATGDFYLDDFVLSEITDRYYLIKNSSQIPNSCYYDIFNNYQGVDYNLGCSQYTDRGGLKNNLHKFTQLCSDSAVGCEQMIDTKNYGPSGPGYWENGVATSTCSTSDPNCVYVPGDTAQYAVYDSSKQCNIASQGCSRLGQGQGGASLTGWSDVFKLNNPDQYNTTLCDQGSVGCSAWPSKSDNSVSYFKDPGNNVCIYRASQDPTIGGLSWYKIPAKRCDMNGDNIISGSEKGSAICLSDSDCGGGHCLVDNNDYPCSYTLFKTIGLGGAGNQVSTPDQSAGLCAASDSSCTEYIDPVTQFAPNLVNDPNFQVTDSNSGTRGNWGVQTDTRWNPTTTQQIIKVTPNKLYSLIIRPAVANGNLSATVSLTFPNMVEPLLSDNTFGNSTNSLSLSANGPGNSQPIIFDSFHNNGALLSGGAENQIIELKELSVSYQLQSNIDKTSCNGQVKFDNGCVLFNERTMSGANGLTSLNTGWDAYNTIDGQGPKACTASLNGSCTANQLIKVRPDRVCSQWLDCLTYTQDPVTKQLTCYAVGQCDRLDDKNDCADFLNAATTTPATIAPYDANATGYSLVNDYALSQMKEVGLNTEAHFDFEDSIPALSCQRQVDFSNPPTNTCYFNKNIVADSLVREPNNAPTDYPAHGKSYLKVPATYQISPLGNNSYISLQLPLSGTFDYYLNYLVNTKTSGLGAKVIITDNQNPPHVLTDAKTGAALVFYSTGNNGWSRIINKFSVSSDPNKYAQINIYLTSDTTDPKASGYVYFDDINIEPVLQVAPDKYVARECRLYPAADSLTCLKAGDNTISDGLEGYCLQHDPFNTADCLLWYPVDKIASAQGFPTTLGYKGAFPLNYCTQADGNFDFVEKRVGFQRAWLTGSGAVNVTGMQIVSGQYGQTNQDVGIVASSTYFAVPEGTAISAWRYPPGVQQTGTIGYNITHPTATTTVYDQYINFPPVLTGATAPNNGFGCFRSNPPGGPSGGPLSWCGPDYIIYVSRKDDSDTNTHIWCVPADQFNSNGMFLQTDIGTIPDDLCSGQKFFNGWFKYNGFWSVQSGDNCHDPSACPGTNEATNANPPIRIYDYNNKPADENGLKLVASSDPSQIFRLTCDRFTETVNGNNDNKAWVLRVDSSSIYTSSTPPFFNSALQFYGRNRESIPFGAATWPDNYDLLTSDRLNFRNQYSTKNNETVFAGRPYGCTGGDCGTIGYCSGDPNVFCLVGGESAYSVATLTCGGLGTCQSLNMSPSADNSQNLKKIFLASYNSFNFDLANSSGYVSSATGSYDVSAGLSNCPNNTRPDDSNATGANDYPTDPTFCTVYPKVSNINLYSGDSKVVYATGKTFTIQQAGIYRLEFNSTVDAQQQPLRRIYIDWGDGNNQIITDQDQHPSPANPHVFYHYYSQTGARTVLINITDNWGSYGQD